MDNRDTQARRIQDQIREILLHDWDPIGVQDELAAQDEYDAYVGGIYRLLVSGPLPQAVADHLARIEDEDMGFGTPAESLLGVATKLCALSVKLGVVDGAV